MTKNGKSNLLINEKFYRTLLFLVIVLVLVACNKQSEPNVIGEVDAGIEDLNARSESVQLGENEGESDPSIRDDIKSLVAEKNIRLSISQNESDFIPASEAFTKRIVSYLALHGDPVAKVANVDFYDLVLRFEGYADIHLNLDTNTYWFAEADQLYHLPFPFSDQWQRYIIRLVDDEPMYDTFEKTILQKSIYIDSDGSKNTATLFYDGDVRLQINEAEAIVDRYVSEDSLSYNVSTIPTTLYTMKTVGEQPLVAIVNDFYTARGGNANLDVFAYDGQELQSVFSTSEMACELNAVDFEKGEVEVGLPFADTSLIHVLSAEERELTNERVEEFKKYDMNVDDEFIQSVRALLSCDTLKIEFVESDQGVTELNIHTQLRTMGASMPIRVNTDVVFVFEIVGNEARYIESKEDYFSS